MSHTVTPLGEAHWACAHPQLLTSLSQMPAAQTSFAVTGAPDQSPCCSTEEQLEPELAPRGSRAHLQSPCIPFSTEI